MSVDPAVLCKFSRRAPRQERKALICAYTYITTASSFPHGRRLHYWAKSTLFSHPVAKKILLNAGTVPVYRNAGNNQELYKGSFDVLAVGEVVAIFPEGAFHLFANAFDSNGRCNTIGI